MSKKSEKEASKQDAINALRGLIKPGDTVYTIVRSCSRTNMSMRIDVYIVNSDCEIAWITPNVATACGYSRKPGAEGMLVHGGGMDMCFSVVYELGRTLFPDGGPLDKSSPARQSQEARAGKDRETDGGYLLRKRDL